jgi:hypothetical protein
MDAIVVFIRCSFLDARGSPNWGFSRPSKDLATLRGARCLTYAHPHMRDVVLAVFHVTVVTAKLHGSGGVRAVMAQNLLHKQH